MIKIVLISILILKSVNLSDVTYYEILGISKQASTQDIRQAYKKLAIKFHPDKNPNATDQQKFLKITEAYETLKDPEKRHKYDLYGSQNSYTRKYDYHSQTEYNNLYYNGLYHNDAYVSSLSGSSFSTYLSDGMFFINFYSPFCPPCQNLADHWKKLAEVYTGIIKVAALNCKLYNSFCYNHMRINSYPSLLFYPNGKNGHYIYYRGPHTFESLEKFVITYIRNNAYVKHTTQVQSTDKPTAYVVDTDAIDSNTLARIAYRLKSLVTILEARGDLKSSIAKEPETVVVFKYKQIHKEIQSSNEHNIVKEIVHLLPTVEKIGLEKMKKIRNLLRSGHNIPWVLHFAKKGDEKLLMHQMRLALPDLHFGEIDCEELNDLCNSLQAEETPAFGVLKVGGAYQRLWQVTVDRLKTATAAVNLHSLSPSDLTNILKGDMAMWVLLVVPHEASWDQMLEPFTQASLELVDTDIHFGIMVCTGKTEQYCNVVARDDPTILVQNRTVRHYYNGRINENDIIQYIQLLLESADMELTEEKAMEVAANREHSWLIAYLPPHCGTFCDQLLHEWRLVTKRLRPVQQVRCGAVVCAARAGPLCANVRAATARLYPATHHTHYVVNLQHLSKAPYILEWALEFVVDTIVKLNWQSFTKSVIAEELNPSRSRKPWLVYFHSPRCYRCYEMFPDFAITAVLLKDSMQFGKVNCDTDYGLCQHEQINSYPSIRLYLNRNSPNAVSRVVALPVKHYSSLIQSIRPHIARYDGNLLENIDIDLNTRLHFHDEL